MIEADVLGARGVGMGALWLRRGASRLDGAIGSLAELEQVLQRMEGGKG